LETAPLVSGDDDESAAVCAPQPLISPVNVIPDNSRANAIPHDAIPHRRVFSDGMASLPDGC
jgi:hypothetical protein